MFLSEYITQMGLDKTSELFSVTTVTTRSWRDLESIPAPAKAHEIVTKTHGLVGWGDIYPPYFEKQSDAGAIQ